MAIINNINKIKSLSVLPLRIPPFAILRGCPSDGITNSGTLFAILQSNPITVGGETTYPVRLYSTTTGAEYRVVVYFFNTAEYHSGDYIVDYVFKADHTYVVYSKTKKNTSTNIAPITIRDYGSTTYAKTNGTYTETTVNVNFGSGSYIDGYFQPLANT